MIERLHEALVSGVPGMDDSRGFVLGHKTGLQRAIALVEAVKTEKLTELDPRMVQQGD